MTSFKTFYAALAAGVAFIAIGVAASIYSTVAVDVPLDNTVRPGLPDVLTPDMDVGSTASITISGSTFDVTIEDPEGQTIRSETAVSSFSHEFTAQKAGEHTITIRNTGNTDLTIDGHAQTKGSALSLSGTLMLIITGIVVIGLSLRFRRR